MRRPGILGFVLAAVALAFVGLPLIGLLGRTSWERMPTLLGNAIALDALRVSLTASFGAALLSTAFGVPLAWVLARGRFPGLRLVRALVLLPVVLPPVVGGMGLLAALGRRGLVGGWLLATTGVQLTFTVWGTILAATFVAMPLAVLAAESGFRNLDPDLEGAAETLGASPTYVLRRVIVPAALPQIGAGLVLAWARALGEFGATITFAGNLPGRTQTLPLAVFQAAQTDPDAAIALSLLLVAVSLVVLVALRDRILAR